MPQEPFVKTFQRLALAIALFAAGAAGAQWNSSAESPFAPKVLNAEPLRLAAGHKAAARVTLAPIGADAIDEAKLANSSFLTKRLQIGIGRPVLDAAGTAQALSWTATAAGNVAHWNVTSPGARALRVGLDATRIPAGTEIRFAALSQPGTVYGPFTARDLLAEAATYWSPVLEGETAIVEVMLPFGTGTADLGLAIDQVSHLFASPSDPAVESLAKASGSCEKDLICLSATDSALADTGRAVAKMTFTDGLGSGTYLCTGTLLNPTGGSFTPYFYSANHCISTQASASTLTTHWFYDRTTCGGSIQNPAYTQLPGGATLLYANQYSDGLLLRLNSTPPSGAIYSGWDAATVSLGSAATAVHHPAGDYKKVSLGSIAAFASPSGSDTNFLQVNWNSTATGVTEGGSSGSGIFTLVASPREYRLRGGLYGGPSSCTASTSNLHDYYSRFDQVYPSIAQYLNPGTSSCSYSLSPTSVTIGSTASTGTFSVTASSGCSITASSDASWLTVSVSGGTVTYSAAANSGGARVGNISVGNSRFTVAQQAPLAAAGSNLVTNPGFETGTAAWTESATGGFPIVTDDASGSHSGNWYAWLGGYDSGTDTLYQTVTIPAGSNTASLRFYYWIETEETTSTIPFDTMTVSIANPTTGARIATLASFSNLNATTGWVQSNALDLSSYRGQTLRLVFSASTDSSRITSFYVDDITLTASGGTSSSNNYTALWWKGADESGWGVNVNHQGDLTYSTLFTYDTDGTAMWLVSTGTRTNGDTFTGDLLRTTGPGFNANPFTPITGSNVTNVGSMTLAFSGSDTGTLTYSVNGTLVVKTLQKYVFGSRAAQCVNTTGDRSGLTNYQDLWWSGVGESGWGINFTHQDNTIYATLFNYQAGSGTANKGMWAVSTMPRQPDGSYLGILYLTRGPAFNANPWTGIISTNVGTMTVRFSNGNSGTLTYSVDGTVVTKSITRDAFSSPVPACTS
jgi:hypothetical protein